MCDRDEVIIFFLHGSVIILHTHTHTQNPHTYFRIQKLQIFGSCVVRFNFKSGKLNLSYLVK